MNGLKPALARAFRRAALPLGWYYIVTLGLPLANGAAQSGAAFVNHAVLVFAVPPILITLVCTIQKTAQVFAAALVRRDHGRGSVCVPRGCCFEIASGHARRPT